jgi:hypothetical protein
VECSARSGYAFGSTYVLCADWQTNQCGIPVRGFDTAGQHHDTGAERNDSIVAAADTNTTVGRECANTTGALRRPRDCGSKKAGFAETFARTAPAYVCAGPTCACSGGSNVRARRVQ